MRPLMWVVVVLGALISVLTLVVGVIVMRYALIIGIWWVLCRGSGGQC